MKNCTIYHPRVRKLNMCSLKFCQHDVVNDVYKLSIILIIYIYSHFLFDVSNNLIKRIHGNTVLYNRKYGRKDASCIGGEVQQTKCDCDKKFSSLPITLNNTPS